MKNVMEYHNEEVKNFTFKSSSTRALMSTGNTDFREPSSKKPRTDELCDIWDDDDEFDGDMIDDCFRKATQEISNEKDVTLLSSYSLFKAPQHIITSTQCHPSTSSHDGPEDKFKELQAKYAEKEGEASILRSNLENLRTSYQVDQERKQLEWKDKLSLSEKEKKTIKSELEFKNIEIVNLKQQIAELTRLVNGEQNLLQRTQLFDTRSTVSSPEKRQEAVSTGNYKIYINVEKHYPLRSFNASFQPQLFQDKSSSASQISEFLEKKTIRQDLTALSTLSSDELNSNTSNSLINKTLWSTYQLLKMFQNHLKEMNTKSVSFQKIETSRLIEISFLCSEILDFFQKMIPFSRHLKKCLLKEILIRPTDIAEFSGVIETQSSHLALLSNILTSIRSTGKEKECSNFLSNVITLLCTIFTSEDLTNLKQNTMRAISKELISLNLDLELMDQVNIFLNVIASNSALISFLCSKEEDVTNHSNKDSCRFAQFVGTLEKMLMAVEQKDEFLKVSENIVNLTYNIFQFDDVHQQEIKTCNCFVKLYKLTVGTIYKDLGTYDTSLNKHLKNRIKMLSLLIFNAYDLTQKYVADFAQFKEIVYSSHAENGTVNLKNLEKLSASEDFPMIPKEKFSGILL